MKFLFFLAAGDFSFFFVYFSAEIIFTEEYSLFSRNLAARPAAQVWDATNLPSISFTYYCRISPDIFHLDCRKYLH